MRFFDTNILFVNLGNTINQSSGTGELAFNENLKYFWTSDGEGTDGDDVYIENIISIPKLIDRIFIRECNIEDLLIEVDVGAGYITLTADEIQSNTENTSHLYLLNTPILLNKIKVSGSDTLIPNEEKRIRQVYAFKELGRIKDFADIDPSRERLQKISKLQAGKVDIITFGKSWNFSLVLKSHYVINDNEIINTILQRDEAFFIWINDNTQSIMKMYQEPFRFQDIYKVAIQSKDSPNFNKNLFFSGLNEKLNLTEVI